jgi:hypothetical protein
MPVARNGLMKKALILAHYFPPFSGPGAQHPFWFYRYLPEHGIETHAVTNAVYADAQSPEPDYAANGITYAPAKWLRGVARWLYQQELRVQVRLGYWEPGFVWACQFAIPAANKLIRQGGFDTLVSVSPTVASHWAALQLKRKFSHLRWVADFQDPFLGNPFHGTKRFGDRARAFEEEVFQRADLLSANTDNVAKMWAGRYPQHQEKMVVTWGGYDPEEPVPKGTPAPGSPVLAHVGMVYRGRTPVALLQALAAMNAAGGVSQQDLILRFVGTTDLSGVEQEAASLKAAGMLELRGAVPRQEAMDAAASVHYSLLLDITPGYQTLQVPAKLFDQIRLGRPILAVTSQGSPSQRILARSGIPHQCVAPDATSAAYEAAIHGLLQQEPKSSEPTEEFMEKFSARGLAGSLAAAIHGLPRSN